MQTTYVRYRSQLFCDMKKSSEFGNLACPRIHVLYSNEWDADISHYLSLYFVIFFGLSIMFLI
jgi:hypothetical protein